jgi:hypothetical protein
MCARHELQTWRETFRAFEVAVHKSRTEPLEERRLHGELHSMKVFGQECNLSG